MSHEFRKEASNLLMALCKVLKGDWLTFIDLFENEVDLHINKPVAPNVLDEIRGLLQASGYKFLGREAKVIFEAEDPLPFIFDYNTIRLDEELIRSRTYIYEWFAKQNGDKVIKVQLLLRKKDNILWIISIWEEPYEGSMQGPVPSPYTVE